MTSREPGPEVGGRRIAARLDDELAAIRELVVLTLERACTSDEVDSQLESEVAPRDEHLTPVLEDLDASG
jgi:hypothetical protein